MTDKEKLIELLSEVQYLGGLEEKIADRLIANGVTVQKWIPVSERLPEEYEPVLVYDPSVGHGQYVMNATWSVYGWETEFDFDPCENPGITHWMPLPEPPKGE